MAKLILLASATTMVVVLVLWIDAPARVPSPSPARAKPPAGRNIYAAGRVEGASPETELRPRLAGRCAQVAVQEGEHVDVGQVLARIEDEAYRQQVSLAAAEVDLAVGQLERIINGARREERDEAAALHGAKFAALTRAEVELDRVRQLLNADAIAIRKADDQDALVQTLRQEVNAAKARLDQLQAPPRPDDVRIAQARVNAARARLELAKLDLEYTYLRAPARGQILKRNVEPGELIGPHSAAPAIILADTSIFRVRAYVEELDAPRVQTGMPATILADGLPGRSYTARVTRLSPRMGPKSLSTHDPRERNDTKTREAWLDLDQSDGLVIGLRVDVLIDASDSH